MINNDFKNTQDHTKIQDLFILNSNIIKFQFHDGQIFQIKRSFPYIEALKDIDEQSFEIINLVDTIKKQLIEHFKYETVKYRGRNAFSLNFLGKEKETRAIHQIAYAVLKNDSLDNIQKLYSTLNKLQKLEHPNVQRIIKHQRFEKFYIIFMEECIGTFQDLLVQQQFRMNQNTFLKYSGEYVSGLEYLVDKIQISSQVFQLTNLLITFNHLAVIPILIAGVCEITQGNGVYQIEELIESIKDQIYQNKSIQKKQSNSVVEKYANHGMLVQLLINILIPNMKNKIGKNYTKSNKLDILSKMIQFDNKEQILNIIIDLESYFDSNLKKQTLQNFSSSLSHLKKGQKWFMKPQDISINSQEQQLLARNYINYDFAQVSQNKYIPVLDEDLINNYFMLYQQELYQMKRKNPQLFNSEYQYNSLVSISQFKEQTSPSKVLNDISSCYNSQLKIEKEIQYNFLQNIQILEDFVCDNIDDFDLEDRIKQEDLKAILDQLCSYNLLNNNNNNKDQESQNRFDSQIFQEIIEKMNFKSPKFTLQLFLEAYLEYEKDLINSMYNGQQLDQYEGSINSKFINPVYTDQNRELESPFKNRDRKESIFTHDLELQTQGVYRDIKERMQLLHLPFQQLLNPAQKLEEIKVNKLMQEINNFQKDIDFKIEVKEEQIFKLLDKLCYNHNKQVKVDYDKKPFLKIIENVSKSDQILNLYNFLNTYLIFYKDLQQKLKTLVVQNCDIKSLDQDQIMNLVTFNNMKYCLDSIHELNYLEYNNELKQLKIPFRRIFQKIERSANVNNIKKKQPNKMSKLPNFGDNYYQSQLYQQQPQIQNSTTKSIILTVVILVCFLLLILLLIYFVK